MISSKITVGEHLLARLKEIGVDHLFGVPGDFVLGFFSQAMKSALDAAARRPGLSC
jgi:indolepyruvate decarboxylase